MSGGARDPGRILVTGATGFLGRALVRRLRDRRAQVVASDLAGETPCDVTDATRVDEVVSAGGFDTIVHCGAVSGPMVMVDRPLDVWAINVTGTVNLLEAARRHGRVRFILCSTCEVYGEADGVAGETDLPSPANVYAASKVAAEQAMLGYILGHGLDAAALRLGWIYGPGRQTPTALEAMLQAAVSGTPETIDADPDERAHYIYIDDAVDGVLRAVEAPELTGRIYNVTAGTAVPMRDVAASIHALCPGARFVLSPSAPCETHPAGFATRLAEAELGFKARTGLADGLRRTLAPLAR